MRDRSPAQAEYHLITLYEEIRTYGFTVQYQNELWYLYLPDAMGRAYGMAGRARVGVYGEIGEAYAACQAIRTFEAAVRNHIQSEPTPRDDAMRTVIIQEVKQNGKINAIKMHRLMTGFGLKESKDQVEAWMAEEESAGAERSIYAAVSRAQDPEGYDEMLVKLHAEAAAAEDDE